MLIRSNLKGHSNKGCLRPGETIIDYTVVTEPMFFLKQDFLTMGQFTEQIVFWQQCCLVGTKITNHLT